MIFISLEVVRSLAWQVLRVTNTWMNKDVEVTHN